MANKIIYICPMHPEVQSSKPGKCQKCDMDLVEKKSEDMNKFFNSCRRCLNPWVIGLIIVVILGLLIFVPIIGVASLIVFLPLVGCTAMCGGMAFFMMRDKKKQ